MGANCKHPPTLGKSDVGVAGSVSWRETSFPYGIYILIGRARGRSSVADDVDFDRDARKAAEVDALRVKIARVVVVLFRCALSDFRESASRSRVSLSQAIYGDDLVDVVGDTVVVRVVGLRPLVDGDAPVVTLRARAGVCQRAAAI